MNAELDRRAREGGISHDVTLADIGIGRITHNGITNADLQPGLSALHSRRPGWFIRGNGTKVTSIIAHIMTDPTL